MVRFAVDLYSPIPVDEDDLVQALVGSSKPLRLLSNDGVWSTWSTFHREAGGMSAKQSTNDILV